MTGSAAKDLGLLKDRWSEVEALSSDSSLEHVSAIARAGITEYLRWTELAQAFDDDRMKQAYRKIKSWGQIHGFWSSTFGFLDEDSVIEGLTSIQRICDSRTSVDGLVSKCLKAICEDPSVKLRLDLELILNTDKF